MNKQLVAPAACGFMAVTVMTAIGGPLTAVLLAIAAGLIVPVRESEEGDLYYNQSVALAEGGVVGILVGHMLHFLFVWQGGLMTLTFLFSTLAIVGLYLGLLAWSHRAQALPALRIL